MSCRSLRRSMVEFAGAIFALLALAIFAPATARAAGCDGHYVLSAAQRAEMTHGAGLDVLADATQVDGKTLPNPEELPCTGPTCSRRSGVPDAPTTSPTVVTADPWCDTTAFAVLGIDPSHSGRDPEPFRHPRHVSGGIERPPRTLLTSR